MVFAFQSEYQFFKSNTTINNLAKKSENRFWSTANTKWQTLCIEGKQSAKVSNFQVIPVIYFFNIFNVICRHLSGDVTFLLNRNIYSERLMFPFLKEKRKNDHPSDKVWFKLIFSHGDPPGLNLTFVHCCSIIFRDIFSFPLFALQRLFNCKHVGYKSKRNNHMTFICKAS